MRMLRLIPLLVSLALAVTGCNESPSLTRSDEVDGTGSVAFRLTARQADSLAGVADTLRVVVDNGTTKHWTRVPLGANAELSALPPGVWNVVVTLTRGQATVYQGSGFVTVVGGRTVPAKILLSPATGNLTVEIGIDPVRKLPIGLQQTWILESFPGMDTMAVQPTLQLLESGASIGSGLWNSATRGAWSADDSLLWLDNDLTIKGANACVLSAPSGRPQNAFCKLFGKPLRWFIANPAEQLSLTDPTTGQVLAIFRSSIAPLPRIEFDPYAVVGVWGLLSMPIEGLDQASGSMLIFDSTGRISGTIACNSVSGSWRLNSDGKLSISGFSSTFVSCEDSVTNLVIRGMHLLAFSPAPWSIDTTSSGMEEISLFSPFTGVKVAVFSLARFGRTYPAAATGIPPIDVVKRPIDRLLPLFE